MSENLKTDIVICLNKSIIRDQGAMTDNLPLKSSPFVKFMFLLLHSSYSKKVHLIFLIVLPSSKALLSSELIKVILQAFFLSSSPYIKYLLFISSISLKQIAFVILRRHFFFSDE